MTLIYNCTEFGNRPHRQLFELSSLCSLGLPLWAIECKEFAFSTKCLSAIGSSLEFLYFLDTASMEKDESPTADRLPCPYPTLDMALAQLSEKRSLKRVVFHIPRAECSFDSNLPRRWKQHIQKYFPHLWTKSVVYFRADRVEGREFSECHASAETCLPNLYSLSLS